MTKFWLRIITPLAISGLVISLASPALAASEYDPNDPYFDPSGTYEQSADPVSAPTDDATEVVNNDQQENETPLQNSDANEQTEENSGSTVISQDQTAGIENETNTNNEAAVVTQEDGEQSAAAGNEQTGADSTNESVIEQESNQQTVLDNQAEIDNQVSGDANTGANSANFNTGSGSVQSGDADLAANLINIANSLISGSESLAMPLINIFSDLIGDLVLSDQGSTALTINDPLGLNQIAANFQTGADSTNNSAVSRENASQTDIVNDGSLNNALALAANSGNNTANGNTGDGEIQSGDANVAANVVNFLNTTILSKDWWLGMVNIFGNWDGNLVLPSLAGEQAFDSVMVSEQLTAANRATGADSLNEALINNQTSSDTMIDNEAGIINSIGMTATTGANETVGNTGDGLIQTGTAGAQGNMVTMANTTVIGDTWWMMLVNTLGGWAGALIGSPDGSVIFQPLASLLESENALTGADSDNTAVIDNSQQASLTIDNEAIVGNQLELAANTGSNQANFNTGKGEIQSGNANIMANLINFVNNTFNVGKWMLGVVNVFGQWNGEVRFGEGSEQTVFAPSAIASELVAGNEQTGAESTNQAAIDILKRNGITINNQVDFRKDVDIEVNTSDNNADMNTGSGRIKTGNVNVRFREKEILNQIILLPPQKEKKEEKQEEQPPVIPPVVPPIIPPVTPSEIIPEIIPAGGGEEVIVTPTPPAMGGEVPMPPILPVAGSNATYPLVLTLLIGTVVYLLRYGWRKNE